MGSSIQTFHTGFQVCLIVMIAALLMSVIMFFVFDIRTIYAIRSGKAQRRDMEKTKERNLKTDQLGRKKGLFGSGSLLKTGQTSNAEERSVLAEKQSETMDTAALNNKDQNSTSVLSDALKVGVQVQQAPVGFRFVITENIMVVHTKEVII